MRARAFRGATCRATERGRHRYTVQAVGDGGRKSGAGGGVELPFGGHGLSGHGRGTGVEALMGLTTLKTVAARHG